MIKYKSSRHESLPSPLNLLNPLISFLKEPPMTDTEYMQSALDEAQKAYHEGEIPIGAVLV